MTAEATASALVEKLERRERSCEARSSCPYCGRHQVKPRFRLPEYDALIGDCSGCGLGRIDPLPDADMRSACYGEVEAQRHSVDEATCGTARKRTREALRECRFLTRRLSPGSRILDIDCGLQAVLPELAALGFQTVEAAIHQPPARDLDARIQLAVVKSLAAARFSDNLFDAVVLWNTLPRLRDPVETISEIRRILKPGGLMAIAFPNYASLQARLFGPHWFQLDPPRDCLFFPVRVVKALLREGGFRCAASRHFWPGADGIGWKQSVANARGRQPRRTRYEDWLAEASGKNRRVSASLWGTLPLSALTAVLRRGSMVRVLASVPVKTGDITLTARDHQAAPALRKGVAYEFPQTQPNLSVSAVRLSDRLDAQPAQCTR